MGSLARAHPPARARSHVFRAFGMLEWGLGGGGWALWPQVLGQACSSTWCGALVVGGAGAAGWAWELENVRGSATACATNTLCIWAQRRALWFGPTTTPALTYLSLPTLGPGPPPAGPRPRGWAADDWGQLWRARGAGRGVGVGAHPLCCGTGCMSHTGPTMVSGGVRVVCWRCS